MAAADRRSEGDLFANSQSPRRQLWSRLSRKRLAMVALAVILVIYLSGAFAPAVAPYSYTDQNLERGLEGPSLDHLFGTDRLGRDMPSRVMYSARPPLIFTPAVLLRGTTILGYGLGRSPGLSTGRGVRAGLDRAAQGWQEGPVRVGLERRRGGRGLGGVLFGAGCAEEEENHSGAGRKLLGLDHRSSLLVAGTHGSTDDSPFN